MALGPHVHLHLDVALDGGTLVGRVGRDGGAARPFTGWIALNAAVEHLLAGEAGELTPAASPREARVS